MNKDVEIIPSGIQPPMPLAHRTSKKLPKIRTAPSGLKLTLLLFCTFVFCLLRITCLVAGEQPEEKITTDTSPKQEIVVMDPASNTNDFTPEKKDEVFRQETKEAPWQEFKLDTPTPIDAVKNSNCPCDSTGVRSRLMRMSEGAENSANSAWSGRGRSGGMGRGRR
jgi:hypothetical protein